MEPETQWSLDKAARNRAVAADLINPNLPFTAQPPPLDWAVVAMYYAAAHCLNAYLWEYGRWSTRHHDQRQQAVNKMPSLRGISAAYGRLFNLDHAARYDVHFRITQQQAEDAFHRDLDTVGREIHRLLGIPYP